jgi:acetyltransferase-like isoleucine patch superfamily enzyme
MSRPSGFPRRPAFYLLAALSSLPIEASRTKAFLLRRLGATVGRGVRFGRGTFLLCRNYRETVLGDWTSLGDRTFIAVGALRTGEDARIDMRVTMRGRGKVSIGAGCYIGADVYFDVKCDVTVEDDAGVGPGTWVFTHSVWQSVLEGGPRVFAPVRICREAWIPACVFIMPGVTVGERAIIGARSVVLADVPPGVLAAGSPAKVLRTAEQRTAEAPTPEERW